MRAKKLAVVSLVSLVACLAGQASLGLGAKHVPVPALLQEFKLIPRVNLWGFGGDYTRGEGQAMMPILGDVGHAFYFLAEGNKAVNDSDWIGGVGLGYRQIFNERIFGGYLIGDYQNSPENNGFFIANPGLEMLSETWDIDINGYLPFKQKKSFEIRTDIASEDLGITHFMRFTGHNEFDHKMRVFSGDADGRKPGEEAGRGFDGEIGRTIPRIEDLRVYLGGYHFDFDDADAVNGVEVRAVYECNSYLALEGGYIYDNEKHNQAVVGLRITLGGYSSEENKRYGIATRLLYPIEHDLATGTSSTKIVSTLQKSIDLGEFTIHDNLQFFEPLGSNNNGNIKDIGPGIKQGSGTYEDPYIGFTPENVDGVKADAHIGTFDPFPVLYFAPGSYSFTEFTSRTIDNRFSLPTGWGMYGRIADYKNPATGLNRATFSGGLDLSASVGSEKTTLDSIRILNSKGGTLSGAGLDNATLHAVGTQGAVLNNVDIQNAIVAISDESVVGIYGENSKFTLNHSNVLASNSSGTGASQFIFGLILFGGQLDLSDANSISGVSNIGSMTAAGNVAADAVPTGIDVDSATININGNKNVISAVINNGTLISTGGQASMSGLAKGIFMENNVILNIYGNENTILAKTVGATVTAATSALTSLTSAAMEAVASKIEIRGNGNAISAETTGGAVTASIGAANVTYDSKVLELNRSNMYIYGNGNNILGTASGGAVAPTVVINVAADGIISFFQSNILMQGNNNSITAIATAGIGGTPVGLARGVDLFLGSTLNFMDSATGTNITVGGSTTSTGILAEASSNLQKNGSSVTGNLGSLESLISFKLAPGFTAGLGSKVEWGLQILPW